MAPAVSILCTWLCESIHYNTHWKDLAINGRTRVVRPGRIKGRQRKKKKNEKSREDLGRGNKQDEVTEEEANGKKERK